MSSILKALRKLEEEKRQAGHVAPDLSIDQGTAAKRSGPLLPLCAGTVLGAVMVGLFLLWQPEGPVTSQGNRPEAIPPAGYAADSGSPQSKEPATSQDELAEPNRDAPLNEQKMPAGQRPAKESVIAPVPVVVLPPETIAKGVSQPVGRRTAAEKPSLKTETVPAAVPDSPAPDNRSPDKSVPEAVNAAASSRLPDGVLLQVSEIYFQDDSASSMAVVNDLPVMIGSRVDSAVIKEIRPDAVLVTIDGKVYAVALTRP